MQDWLSTLLNKWNHKYFVTHHQIIKTRKVERLGDLGSIFHICENLCFTEFLPYVSVKTLGTNQSESEWVECSCCVFVFWKQFMRGFSSCSSKQSVTLEAWELIYVSLIGVPLRRKWMIRGALFCNFQFF